MNLNIFRLLLSIALLVNIARQSAAQSLQINAVCYNKPIELNSFYISSSNDTLQFTCIRFYVACQSKDAQTHYHLLDLVKPKSLLIKDVQINGIGVDSLTNYAGAQSDDLDPINGMYWTWQSGYINIKVEGYSSSHGKFTYHIGGYNKPYDSYIALSTNANNKALYVDFGEIVETQLDQGITHIMTPGKNAMAFCENFKTNVSIK